MFDFTGPATVTITVQGPTLDDIRVAIAAELATALTPIKETLVALADDITALQADFDGYKADVDAKLAQLSQQITDLQTQIANGDPAAVDAAAALKADVDAARAELGDANNDGDPAPVEPTA